MNTSSPSSFCSLSNRNSAHELFGLLLTLSIHHKNARVYLMVDTYTKEHITSFTPKLDLEIFWIISLDEYSTLNRHQMEKLGIFTKFTDFKAELISQVLENEADTLFLDADTFLFCKIEDIDNEKMIGVSPHYIRKKDTDQFGFFNAGMIWVKRNKDNQICKDWIELNKKSRFHEQASIEDLAAKYDHFLFGENYNMSWWRVDQSEESRGQICKNFEIISNQIFYKKKPLKLVHTHFRENIFFNQLILDFCKMTGNYQAFLIINRIKYEKWIIKMPKQPRQNSKWNHTNDSFRELIRLCSTKCKDLLIVDDYASENISIFDKIILYDRPTTDWFNFECEKSLKILVGNGCAEKEGKFFTEKGLSVSPFFFWPRYPTILESILSIQPKIEYEDRKIESTFVGNYENIEQENQRKLDQGWINVVEKFELNSGSKHAYSPHQYLTLLNFSKFGLCLPGFGLKCHREMELMALGTVPVFSKNVSSWFYDPLIENVHYLRVEDSSEFKSKIASVSEEKWNEMSENCRAWYQRNVHSNIAWQKILEILFA